MEHELQVSNDHLQKIASARNPLIAIAELIFNGLDADANRVAVRLRRNKLGGLDEIIVIDNGHGIAPETAIEEFRTLGDSWKKRSRRSKGESRLLHGQEGKGRFRAFALGDTVRWESFARSSGQFVCTEITASHDNLKRFELDSAPAATARRSGTIVRISSLKRNFGKLGSIEDAADDLTSRLALYLRQYPAVQIRFDGKRIDPARSIANEHHEPLPPISHEGNVYQARLELIEWNIPVERGVYLCDQDGFALDETKLRIREPGAVFTVYVCSEFFRRLADNDAMEISQMFPEVDTLLGHAREAIKRYFVNRRAWEDATVVERWKSKGVYPYAGEPGSSVEESERKLFEVVAKQVVDRVPAFDQGDPRATKLSMQLLRKAIESGPESIREIVAELLELSDDVQNDLLELLRRTTFASIISSAKSVTDRLDFLRGLELLVFDPKSKQKLLERSQLHKIVETQTWIFGEEFALTISDQSLTEVLRAHMAKLRPEGDVAEYEDEVLRHDGSRGIVDLMLSRSIRQARAEETEHLVVELKRPSKKIDGAVLDQTISYAEAVANDERFRHRQVRWSFWAVSNDLDRLASMRSRQRDRPVGLVHDDEEHRIKVWAMPWSLIIQSAQARMRFYSEALNYESQESHAKEYLKSMYSKYLPALPDLNPHASPSTSPTAGG